jgi:chitin disaccharide deacetylase
MAATRFLIVNADDFGLSDGVNRGIIEAHVRGIVTSASLMVRRPFAGEAALLSREHPRLSLGLHIDLGEWIYQDEDWKEVYTVVPLQDRAAVEKEVNRQLAEFRRLVAAEPTHLDSHQHVHRDEPVRSVLKDIAGMLNVPLRHFSKVHYCGHFYGQTAHGEPYPEAISVDGLVRTLASLPSGWSELCCHPGFADDLDSIYRSERCREVQTLCDPGIRTVLAVQGIEIRSFQSLNKNG